MKTCFKVSIVMVMVLMLVGCNKTKTEPQVTTKPSESTEISVPEVTPIEEVEENTTENEITADMAYEGVANYCRQTYNWSEIESNMYLAPDGETETEHKINFRSYTGAMVYFYVDKTTGIIRIVEVSPIDNTESETGTINLSDYIE